MTLDPIAIPQTRYARAGELHIAYQVFGDGPTDLVFVDQWFSNVDAGIAVHIAARISALAGAGEVLTSNTVKDLVTGSGIVFEPRGPHQLKGIADEWMVYSAIG